MEEKKRRTKARGTHFSAEHKSSFSLQQLTLLSTFRYQSRSDHGTDEEYEESKERRKISERRDKKEHKRKRC